MNKQFKNMDNQVLSAVQPGTVFESDGVCYLKSSTSDLSAVSLETGEAVTMTDHIVTAYPYAVLDLNRRRGSK